MFVIISDLHETIATTLVPRMLDMKGTRKEINYIAPPRILVALLGLKYLEPPFCIQRASNEEVLDLLPTSATCVNLLKLSPCRGKLLYEY